MLIHDRVASNILRGVADYKVIISVCVIILYTLVITFFTMTITKDGVVGNVIIPSIKTNIQLPINYIRGVLTHADKLIINIKHKDFLKIAHKKFEASANEGLYTTAEDWVPAEISYGGIEYKAKVRLKGELADHWRDDGYWSLKVNMRGSDTLFGMDRFSIQHPRTRSFLNEWYFHKILRHLDIIGLRYDFLPVVVNGRDYPIFALEENFDKRLIENNNRREGPVFRISKRGTKETPYFNGVIFYKADKLAENSETAELMRRARRLMLGFLSGELGASEVFDVKLMARFLALNDLFGNYHTLGRKDIRFYFNPITGLIEPVPIDNQDIEDVSKKGLIGELVVHVQSEESIQYKNTPWHNLLFADANFSYAYGAALEEVSDRGWLDRFFESVRNEADEKLSVLYKSYPYYKFRYTKLLYANQDYIRSLMAAEGAVRAVNLSSRLSNKSADSSRYLSVWMANSHSLPVEVVALKTIDGNHNIPLKKTVLLSNQRKVCSGSECQNPMKGRGVLRRVEIEIDNNHPDVGSMRQLELVSRVAGTQFLSTSPLYTKSEIQDNQPSISALEKSGMFIVDENDKTITLKTGSWQVAKDMLVPSGYTFNIYPNTNVDLIEGASILSYSAVNVVGEEDNPVIFRSSDSSAQGIAVIAAGEVSKLEHVIIENIGAKAKNGNFLSGGMTFYESDVLLSNVLFYRNRSEDALNIVRSNFEMDNVEFTDIFADALDADFSNGKVANSKFTNIGNDGIDVSGSTVSVHSVEMKIVGDKGISAGERSRLRANNISINGAKIALASKDESRLTGDQIVVRKSDIGLASYQKKSEFGPASITLSNVLFEETAESSVSESGSVIIIDGRKESTSPGNVYERLYGSK
jgi:hypothetical protein